MVFYIDIDSTTHRALCGHTVFGKFCIEEHSLNQILSTSLKTFCIFYPLHF